MNAPEFVRTFWNGALDTRAYEMDYEMRRALVFETVFGKRYAFVYPEHWRNLPDEALREFAAHVPD